MFFLFFGCLNTPKSYLPEEENNQVLDADGDGFWGDDDCDDMSSLINPNAIELCDGVDNNCDGVIDEDVEMDFYYDGDEDGFGSDDESVTACTAPSGYVLSGGDCDDTDPQVYPSSVEVCDNIDNNCDGNIDEGLTEDGFFDLDGDGFGGAPSSGCFDENLVQTQGDCDDQNDAIHPQADEVCDGIDNNCDGNIDEDLVDTWYADVDGDGFGDSLTTYLGCEPPQGYVLDNQDCDDLDFMIHPDAAEICDYLDNNCDGVIDEGGGLLFLDNDGDGFGDPALSVSSCMPVSGYVSDNSDCNDTESSIHPGADEYCNSIDDDCDGAFDEQGVLDGVMYYPDSDGDGFGAPNGVAACSQPTGYVSDNSDCDDQNAFTYPGAAELDSLTLCMCDEDEDGYGTDSPVANVDAGSDCDDGLDTVYVGADEYCNGIDDNCDGTIDEDSAIDAQMWYLDTDGDGFGDMSAPTTSCYISTGIVADATDCDDGLASVYPGAQEYCNGIDNDCDGVADSPNALSPPVWYLDADGDGFGDGNTNQSSCAQPSGYVLNDEDCDDQSAFTYPGAAEFDSLTLCMCDEDEDGYGTDSPVANVDAGSDCDDGLDSVYVGADEYCNGIDDNCDGTIDEDSAVDALTWYLDTDGDGFGDPLFPTQSCQAPSGSVEDDTDCVDSDFDIHPDALEICDDLIDNNCDGLIDDLDEDTCAPFDIEIDIPSDQVNFNIDNYVGNPSGAVDIYVYVPEGVRVYSNNPSIPAFSTENLPPGSTVTLVNDGVIHGKGGNGACERAGAGQNGGDAIWATVDMTIDTSLGGIYGGGGGGGAGDDPKGGGGGAGGGAGCDGGADGDYNGNGGRGSVRNNGGYGQGGSGTNYNGSYASGGNWGHPPSAGNGGSGGQGGYCTGSNQEGQGGAGGGWGGGGGGGCAHASHRNPGAGGEGGWAVRTFSSAITWDGGYNTTQVKGWVQ